MGVEIGLALQLATQSIVALLRWNVLPLLAGESVDKHKIFYGMPNQEVLHRCRAGCYVL